MRMKLYGVSLALLAAACGDGSAVRDGMTSPTALEAVTIATTHLFGEAPDKTTIFGPVSSVVGPGVELRNFGATVFVNGQSTSGFVDIDFSSTNIVITLIRDQPSGHSDFLRFADLEGKIRDFAAVHVSPSTSYAGFNASRVRVERDLIDLNLTTLRGLRGQEISLDLNVSP